jgi:pimeloyl-ACP methyl ester carboxylesterase
MLDTRFIRNGDIETAYYERGTGEALVLLHGFTGSKLDFHDQLDWFSDTHRVLAPDQRGHGESTNVGAADGYKLDILVADLEGFLTAAGVQRCHLLGHSMGGMVALRFALAHPQRLHSLLLMDTAAEPLTLFPAALRDKIIAEVLEKGCAFRLDAMKQMPMSDAAARGRDYLGVAEHWRRIELKLNQMDPFAWAGLSEEMSAQMPILDQLDAIRCPTTVIVGEFDAPFVEPSARMAQAITGARLETIAQAAHCPQYENADAWRDAVGRHLQRASRH